MSQKLKPQTSEHLASPLGIITEANPLNFPEGATLDEENFFIKADGSRVKRKGLSYDSASGSFEHEVEFVGEESLVNFSYIEPVDFSTITSFGMQVGSNYLTNTNWLGSNLNTVTELEQGEVVTPSYAAGYFFVPKVNDTITVIDSTANTVDSKISIRDFWGEPPVDAPNFKETSSTDTHLYNVVNAGWWGERLEDWKTDNSGALPSLNRIPSFGLTETGWSVTKVKEFSTGTTRAPFGRMVINPFDRGSSRELALQNEVTKPEPYALSLDKTVGFITDVVTFAGRLWYAGIKEVSVEGLTDTTPRFESTVFFSRVVNHYKDGLACFNEVDPTSDLELPPSSNGGGYFSSTETGKIVKIVPYASGLILFSDRGAWFLQGEGGYISPTNLKLSKISSVGTSNKGSVVPAEDKIYFWNNGGIYVVSYDQNVGITVDCISENTVQTLFNNIGDRSARTVTGTYNEADKTVSWLFASTDGSSHKDTQLIYNTAINCFYKYKFWLGEDRRLLGLVPVPVKYDPQVLGYRYIVADIDRVNGKASIRMAALINNEYSDFGEFPVKAYAVTAYNLMGSSQKQKRISHISTHMKNLDGGSIGGSIESDSSCLLSARWSFSSDIRLGKWTRPIEIYRKRRALIAGGDSTVDRYDQEVITSKTRIRGSGSAVSLMFQSHNPKACHLLGWGVEFTTDKR